MKQILDIILPTMDNPQYFDPCINTIIKTGILNHAGRVIVVNNGNQRIAETYARINNIVVLKPKENLGWEGGLKLGLQHSDSPFVVFQNDDTHIPVACNNFYMDLLHMFADNNVAAVGPSTTVAAGWHSIYNSNCPLIPLEVSYLIGFCMMVRRSHLDEVGGIDDTLPGGDDWDLSIRLRKAGKKLVLNPRAFLIHHGFKTGERVKGGPEVKGGWNSQEMGDDTNRALIRKHGFKTYFETIIGLRYPPPAQQVPPDTEGAMVKAYIKDTDKVFELGCGGKKTVAWAIGIDRIPFGDTIPNTTLIKSIADIVQDVQNPLPFADNEYDVGIARHILEHCVDSVKSLQQWRKVIKDGGKLIIAVPDERIIAGIPTNPEHVHAFSPESLKSLMELTGFKEIESHSTGNGISFVAAYRKNGIH